MSAAARAYQSTEASAPPTSPDEPVAKIAAAPTASAMETHVMGVGVTPRRAASLTSFGDQEETA